MRFLSLLALLPAAIAAPLLERRADEDTIANFYIAKLRSDASDSLLSSSIQSVTGILGASPRRTYNFGAFKGYAFEANDGLLTAIQGLSELEYIAPDTVARTIALTSQQDPPYGLARISHREPGTNEYIYDESAGEGTFSYIIDTGIYTEHNDFNGRASFGANFADDSNTDGNGHGTHTAGTTGSSTYGVAKKTQLIAVKVLGADGSGAQSDVIAGIDFAVNDAQSKGRIGKAVANLSLGGPRNQASNDAVAAAVDGGLFMSVAAGNNGLPTFTASPASEPSVCTIGAIDNMDARASFSNFGKLVDVFAPGVDVISTWIDGPNDTNTISGTSMAAPHVAGLGAYLLALEGARDPEALCSRIRMIATKDAITNNGLVAGTLARSPNLIAYNGNGA